MSFTNGALDSSPIELPKITPRKATTISLDDVASRTGLSKKRKADFDNASSATIRVTGDRKARKRAKIASQTRRENVGHEYISQIPRSSRRKPPVGSSIASENIERPLQVSNTLDNSHQLELPQAPLTPPVSCRAIQARVTRSPASPSQSPTYSHLKDDQPGRLPCPVAQADNENPFLETPVGMTRSMLIRSPSPDTPSALQEVARKQQEQLPVPEEDANGEKSYLTYVFKGKRIAVPNEFYNVPHDPRSELPPSHPDFEPSLRLKPRNLFPKAVYTREISRKLRSSSSTTLSTDDPFLVST